MQVNSGTHISPGNSDNYESSQDSQVSRRRNSTQFYSTANQEINAYKISKITN